jgi:hypothetical protein
MYMMKCRRAFECVELRRSLRGAGKGATLNPVTVNWVVAACRYGAMRKLTPLMRAASGEYAPEADSWIDEELAGCDTGAAPSDCPRGLPPLGRFKGATSRLWMSAPNSDVSRASDQGAATTSDQGSRVADERRKNCAPQPHAERGPAFLHVWVKAGRRCLACLTGCGQPRLDGPAHTAPTLKRTGAPSRSSRIQNRGPC